MATVPMGQRQVTPLALRATRALEDLNNQQVGPRGEMANEGPATALQNGWFNAGLMLISCGFHGLMLVKWWFNGG